MGRSSGKSLYRWDKAGKGVEEVCISAYEWEEGCHFTSPRVGVAHVGSSRLNWLSIMKK